MARVSILIPTFDRPERLRVCILAALASTYYDIEVIVGDDGGLGGTVCDSIHDPRLRYVSNPVRLGMAQNWTALLDRADGELVALCMDDDRLAPRFVETCVHAFDAALGRLSVVFTNHYFVDDEGNERIREASLPPGQYESFARDFMLRPAVAVSAAMFTRVAWRSVRPLPDTAAADMVLFGRIAEMGLTFCYIGSPLMHYGLHAAQLSGTGGFRTDAVAAWSALAFTDPLAEQERLRRLGTALTARAALRIREGQRGKARDDLRAARKEARASLRTLALLYAALVLPSRGVDSAARMRRRVRKLQ